MRSYFSDDDHNRDKIKNLRGWFKASLDGGWNLKSGSGADPLATDRDEIEATRQESQKQRDEWERDLKAERKKTPEERAAERLGIHKIGLQMKGKTLNFQEERELRDQYIQKYKEEAITV